MKEKIKEPFKIPFGGMSYEDYSIWKFLLDIPKIFSFDFLKFYFKISKYAFYKFSRIKSVKILKNILYCYRVINIDYIDNFKKTFNLCNSWGSGRWIPEVTKKIEEYENRRQNGKDS